MEGFMTQSHRRVIERTDFPLAWRGYDRDEVNRHLHFLADLLGDLEDAEVQRNAMAAADASARVTAILDKAQTAADEIVDRAERDARAMTASAQAVLEEVSRGLMDQADAIDSEVEALYSATTELSRALRDGADRLMRQAGEEAGLAESEGGGGHNGAAAESSRDTPGPREIALNLMLRGAEPEEVRRELLQDLSSEESDRIVQDVFSQAGDESEGTTPIPG
jgi:hypothetical protein